MKKKERKGGRGREEQQWFLLLLHSLPLSLHTEETSLLSQQAPVSTVQLVLWLEQGLNITRKWMQTIKERTLICIFLRMETWFLWHTCEHHVVALLHHSSLQATVTVIFAVLLFCQVVQFFLRTLLSKTWEVTVNEKVMDIRGWKLMFHCLWLLWCGNISLYVMYYFSK